MNPRYGTLAGFKAMVVALAVAIPLIAASHLHDSVPPIEVWVGSHPHFVPRTATFGQVVRAFRIRARPGRLLDVEGTVIPGHDKPGRILLNGNESAPATRLHDRDRIWAVNEKDRREPLAYRVIHVPGRRPANPQFSLGRAPGVQVVTSGRASGKVVSNVFEPLGPSRIPKAVALTFDDGPDPTDTPRILSILHRMHVTATFFTIGYLVERYPQVIQQEKRLGMAIADHSWNHPNSPPFKTFPPNIIRSETDHAKLALADLGVDVRLFRPPGGSTSGEVETIAQKLGTRVVLWTVDPQDWRNHITPSQIVANVLRHVRAGSIVDLHDGGGNQAATAKALPRTCAPGPDPWPRWGTPPPG